MSDKMKYMNAERNRLKDYVLERQKFLLEEHGSSQVVLKSGRGVVSVGFDKDSLMNEALENFEDGFYYVGTIRGFLNSFEGGKD